jgi:hypothetical protein
MNKEKVFFMILLLKYVLFTSSLLNETLMSKNKNGLMEDVEMWREALKLFMPMNYGVFI